MRTVKLGKHDCATVVAPNRADPDEAYWVRLMSREGLTDGERLASARLWAGEVTTPGRRRRLAAFAASRTAGETT
jgi:hypothetical protein